MPHKVMLVDDAAMMRLVISNFIAPLSEFEIVASAALDLMRSNRITSIFVPGEGGRLEGALHMHDLLAAGLA